MELTVKQYETTVNNAAEISQVLLDMEGGKYVLALFSELVQELLNEGNTSGATSVVRKLYEAAEISIKQDILLRAMPQHGSRYLLLHLAMHLKKAFLTAICCEMIMSVI